MISKEQLHQIMPPASGLVLEKFCTPINDAMAKFDINTPIRQAMFLATVAHESGCFRYMKELATGEAYDIGSRAASLGNTPEDDGDGERLKGRGPIQITGTTMYRKCGAYFGQDFIAHPELLEGPVWGCMSAGWVWAIEKQLNPIADMPDAWRKTWKGKDYNNFEWVTLKINGGQTHLEDRLKYLALAKMTLGI